MDSRGTTATPMGYYCIYSMGVYSVPELEKPQGAEILTPCRRWADGEPLMEGTLWHGLAVRFTLFSCPSWFCLFLLRVFVPGGGGGVQVQLCLEYLRDRVGVPRDLPFAAARQVRLCIQWFKNANVILLPWWTRRVVSYAFGAPCPAMEDVQKRRNRSTVAQHEHYY